MTSQPISLTPPTEPDADWDGIRTRIMAALAGAPGPLASDHNATDPGVTVIEAAAFGLADIHYRLQESGLLNWPLAWPGWDAEPDRHWRASIPPHLLADVATALTRVAETTEARVQAAVSRADAAAAVRTAHGEPLDGALLDLVVDTLRTSWVRRHGLERADAVADAIAWADGAGGDASARDDRAIALLGTELPLWPDELARLVARERRRQRLETAADHEARIASTQSAVERAALTGELVAQGLTAHEAAIALAAVRYVPGALPEGLERTDGSTAVWPPHARQALACEPVTADDYAGLARRHPEVSRAWAVRGRLEGVAWNGVPVRPPSGWAESPAQLLWPLDPSAPAITVIVEVPALRDRAATGEEIAAEEVEGVLREVLATTISTECGGPYLDVSHDGSTPMPRRVVCDEVGAALVRTVEVEVLATLVLPVLADHDRTREEAERRVRLHFEQGRPESRAGAQVRDPLSGPQEWDPQPHGGWSPGEPVRASEVTEILAGVPGLLGVTDVLLRLVDEPTVRASNGEQLPLPAGSVPVLSEVGCFTIETASGQGCGDA